MTEQRSALPWSVDDKDPGELWIACRDRLSPVCMITAAGNVTERDKEDAAFIVKAVNAHDRLVEALQFVVDGYDNQDVNHVDFRVRVYEVALDALASVAARPFYGAECPSYPNCEGGCGLGCTKEIERSRAPVGGASRQGERS